MAGEGAIALGSGLINLSTMLTQRKKDEDERRRMMLAETYQQQQIDRGAADMSQEEKTRLAADALMKKWGLVQENYQSNENAMDAATQAGPDAWATAPKEKLSQIASGQVMNKMYGDKGRADRFMMSGGAEVLGNKDVPEPTAVYNALSEQDRADQSADERRLSREQSAQNHAETMAMQRERMNPPAFEIKDGDPSDIIAQKLASGEITFDQMTKIYPGFSKNASKREAIVERANQLSGNTFNPAQNTLEYKWGGNAGATRTVAAANNAITNVDKLIDLSDQWKRSGSPAFNNLLKEGQFQIGDKTVSNIKEMQVAVGDEVAGVLGYGGASDFKTKLGLELTDPNVSPDVFKSNMKILKHMLETRRETMAAPMGKYADRPGIQSVEKKQPGVETREMGGVTYKKVPGGWEAVE